jgi:glycosyltransferase involved in cell wall biosynthesis
MKKFDIIAGYPFIENSIANRLEPLVKEILKLGFNVTIHINGFYKEIENSRLTYHNYPFVKPKITNSFFRLFFELINFFIIFLLINFQYIQKSKRPDFLIISVPSMLFIFMSVVKFKDIRYICDIRDLTWEYVLSHRDDLLARIVRYVFIFALKKYSLISVTNSTEKNYLIKKGFDCQKVFIMSNGVELSRFNQLNFFNKSQLKKSKPNLVYTGNIGKAQNLFKIVKFFTKTKNQTLFKIIGKGLEKEKILHFLQEKNINNVVILDEQPWQKLIKHLSSSTILLVCLGKNFNSAVPSKTYEYLCTGKPVIYIGPDGACNQLLREFDHCYFFNISEKELEKKIFKVILFEFSRLEHDKILLSKKNRAKIKKLYIREECSKRFINHLLYPMPKSNLW